MEVYFANRRGRRSERSEEEMAALREQETEVSDNSIGVSTTVNGEIRRRRYRAGHPEKDQIAAYYDREIAESSGEDLPM